MSEVVWWGRMEGGWEVDRKGKGKGKAKGKGTCEGWVGGDGGGMRRTLIAGLECCWRKLDVPWGNTGGGCG